jgi:hypothetical protein
MRFTRHDAPRAGAQTPAPWLRRISLAGAFLIAGAIAAPLALPQNPQDSRTSAPGDAGSKVLRGLEIVQHGGYPELRVNGAPFFVHSAAFFYYRTPRDQWEQLLERYRALGINTIDIYIPWNWHEPKEGDLDFDGHTNPRRNLRALLALITQKGFKLIARPGPEILNEWRYGGYPGWLLARPEYKMDPLDWIEGRYPPLDVLNPHDAEAAARGWLENATHMSYARSWLTSVAKELAPYSASHMLHGPSEDPSDPPRDINGPLLFVQLGDDFAEGRANRVGESFWRYVESLRSAVESGGVDVPVFINPTDMRVAASGSGFDHPIAAMGQWYMQPRSGAQSGESLLTSHGEAEIELFTEELKTQPDFPPVMIEYQAGWYTPGDDDRPIESRPENTLLSSRLLIGNGIHGINCFPLQDTYTPAGYSVPWANRSYRWDAALGPDGENQPRLHAERRNRQLLRRWGPQLAASHKRADFGIVYPLGAYSQAQLEPQDIAHISQSVMRIERLGTLAMLSSELLDPEYQPVDQLLRDAVLFLPVFEPDKPQFQLSERSQHAIVEYVRRGGTLVIFPEKPKGKIIEELWQSAPDSASESLSHPADSAVRDRRKVGSGEVIESSKDFFSWLSLEDSLAENRNQREAQWAANALREFISAAGLYPSVLQAAKAMGTEELIISEIVTNEGTSLLGERTAGRGFLSVTNLSADDSVDSTLEVLSPAVSARGAHSDYRSLHIIVPPHESLLLPLGAPMCSSDDLHSPCGDFVVNAGAEFLDARRDGKLLKLLFYTPASAEVRLHFDQQPAHLELDEQRVEGVWDTSTNELAVTIPRGAAPQFQRLLTVTLPYKPDAPEAPKPGKLKPNEFSFFVANAVRIPISRNTFLRSYPPLVLLDPEHPTNVLIQAENRNPQTQRDANISINGDFRGSGYLRLAPNGTGIEKVRLKTLDNNTPPPSPDANGLFHGTLEVRSGADVRSIPIAFLPPGPGGTSHYRYDFDRDGADEWVLENAGLRLIVSPESGGQAVALVDKSTGASLATSVGLLRDNFAYTDNSTASKLRPRGQWGLFNRPYIAEWLSEDTNPALKLRYEAPDTFPAGATIEKTVQFESANTLRVDYRVALASKAAGAPSEQSLHQQAFAAVNSLPATAAADHFTRFCWSSQGTSDAPADALHEEALDKPTDVSKPDIEEAANQHCENFTASASALEVPLDRKSLEVRTPGRPVMAIEWDCDAACPKMTIEPKNFSALFRLEFPPLTPGAAAAQYTIRIRVLDQMP